MDNQRLGELVGGALSDGRTLEASEVAVVFSDEELSAMAAARGLVVGATALEGAATPTAPEAVAEAPVDLLESLPEDKKERALALKAALAKKFEKDGLTEEDFGLVAVGEGEAQRVFVMQTTASGLYKGDFDNIMSKKSAKNFEIEINGQKIDTRTAMKGEVYEAFINDAKARGIDPLPDSQQLDEWTGTWFTGEEPDGLYALYGYVNIGRPLRSWYNRNDDWYRLRVRPAAEV